MKRSAITRAGRLLYGKGLGWRTKLAKALDVQPKTITRWTSGETQIPKTAELAIHYLVVCRIIDTKVATKLIDPKRQQETTT